MSVIQRSILAVLSAAIVAGAAASVHAQPFGLFANAYLDSTRTPVTRITVEVPFRTLVFLKKEGYYDARYDARISVRRDGDGEPTTYVLHGFATVKTYEETRRRDQKSRAWRVIKLPPGDYQIDALLTVKNTSIGMRRSVTLRVPDFLASGMAFNTPTVITVPTPFRATFARWNEVAGQLKGAETPPDAAIMGFDRQPGVRFSVFVKDGAEKRIASDIFYEVVDANDHQMVYGKRRVDLTGMDDEFVLIFNVDEWLPGVYRVNLRAQTDHPQRDATASTEIRIDVTRAMLGADFDATLEVLGLIANQKELEPLRKAEPADRPAAWAKFWAERDPDPNTIENEALTQHLERVQYVARQFSQFGQGWRSDRGRVYIRYGPPEQIDTAMDQRAQGEYEIWRYYTQNRTFVFFDMFGVGDFKLVEGDL